VVGKCATDKRKSPALQLEKLHNRDSPAHGASEESGETFGTEGLKLEHQEIIDEIRFEPPVKIPTDQVQNMETNENEETTDDRLARSSETGLKEVFEYGEVFEYSTHVDPVQENSQNESPRQALGRLREPILGPWPTEEKWKVLEKEILETYEPSYFFEVKIIDLLNICQSCLLVLYKTKVMTTSRLDNTGLKHNVDIVKVIAII
jgi:hypothetical protein